MVHCGLLKKYMYWQALTLSPLSMEEVSRVLDGKGLFFCEADALNKTIKMFQLLFVNM